MASVLPEHWAPVMPPMGMIMVTMAAAMMIPMMAMVTAMMVPVVRGRHGDGGDGQG